MSDELRIMLWAAGCTLAILVLLLVTGCTVSGPLHERKLAMRETVEYREGWVTRTVKGPDAETVALLVGGAVSVVTGSPWPAVAGVGSKGLTAVGEGLGRVAEAPAQVLDNLTTSTR